MTFALQVVAESLSPRQEHVFPAYAQDPGFNPSWWQLGSAKSPVSYCQFLDDGEEVGRAKILPGAGEYYGYTSWRCPPGGATEIDLIEVRIDLQWSGRHYGRRAVEAIGLTYGQPVVALSKDDASDHFWRSLGWTCHSHPDDDEYRSYKRLFTSV